MLLFWLHRKAQKLDINKWPVGGARLETIGNIVYGSFLKLGMQFVYLFNLLPRFSVSEAVATNSQLRNSLQKDGICQPCGHRRVNQGTRYDTQR